MEFHWTFICPHRLSIPFPSTSSHIPLVSPLSSMLYSLGLSLGAALCEYVPGMADRPDPFTRRFSPPSSFNHLSLPAVDSLYICMHLYLSAVFGTYVCLFHSSVRLIFPLFLFFPLQNDAEGGGFGVQSICISRGCFTGFHIHPQSLLKTHSDIHCATS